MHTPTTILAISSGCLAAAGGVLGKIALSSEDSAFIFFTQLLCAESIMSSESCQYYIPLTCRLCLFGLMLYLNAMMLSMFLKALARIDHSLKVVVLNTAANFITTGMMGQFFFKEVMTLKWSVGAFIIVLGMCLISAAGGGSGAVGGKPKGRNMDHLNRDRAQDVYDHLPPGVVRDTFRN